MAQTNKKKLIWAIDPYGEAKLQTSAATFAKSLHKKIDIQVVYVVGGSGIHAESDQKAIRAGLAQADERVEKMLKELKFKPQIAPKILAHHSEYVRTGVKLLVSYAKKSDADAVLVSTNARSGFLRLTLGSFAETLILESTIPTMIVNPKAKVESRPGVILFPSDLSDSSWKAFREVVSFAKATNATIRIFYQHFGEAQAVPSGVSYFRKDRWLDGDSLVDEKLQKVNLKIKKWSSFAKTANVQCDHVIKFGIRNIAAATLALAKKEKVWIIAMATMTGPIAAAFLGSNARSIARSAQCPVWVLYVHGK